MNKAATLTLPEVCICVELVRPGQKKSQGPRLAPIRSEWLVLKHWPVDGVPLPVPGKNFLGIKPKNT